LLRFLHPSSSRCGEFPALDRGRFRRGGGVSGATWKHGTEVCNLAVNPALLRLESCYGSDDDFVREFW
jgi:hypothetical protein